MGILSTKHRRNLRKPLHHLLQFLLSQIILNSTVKLQKQHPHWSKDWRTAVKYCNRMR